MKIWEAHKDQDQRPFAPGVQIERTIPAMRIVIQYRSRQNRVVSEHRGQECLFYYMLVDPPTFDNEGRRTIHIEEPTALDAYAIRDAFEKVASESEALKFLSDAGEFWSVGPGVTWRQFKEWQQFVYLVRQDAFPELAMKDEEARHAMHALMGADEFFTVPDIPQSEWEKEWLSRLGEPEHRLVWDPEDESQRWRQNQHRILQKWFYRPQGDAMKIESLLVEDDNARPRGSARKSGRVRDWASPRPLSTQEWHLKPVMVIHARSILEAIAATVYADRCHPARYAKCEHCGKLFKIESDHGQKYCRQVMSDGTVLELCRNAAAQKAWRERHAKKKQTRSKEDGKESTAIKGNRAKGKKA